jgi:hypothetical protein
MIRLVWTPSHCDIAGNEYADKMAKLGTNETAIKCECAYTSIAWLRRQANKIFLDEWNKALQLPVTWKYPEKWSSWSFDKARAIFKVYCNRTLIDPLPGKDPQQCHCSTATLSSHHILERCPLFDKARSKLQSKIGSMPLTPIGDIILSDEGCEAIFQFMKESGLGLKTDLEWESNVKFAQVQNSYSEEESNPTSFMVGDFE